MKDLQRTVEEWQQLLGAQIRTARIQSGLDQVALAEQADVSVSAVRTLETGAGSSLQTLIRVVRAIDRTDWLATLAPTVSISPLQMARDARHRSVRARVSRRRHQPRERPA